MLFSARGRATLLTKGLWLALLGIWLATSSVHAAPPHRNEADRTDPPAYKEAIQSAIREFDLGNWAEARAHFTQAHQILPNARTFRALGLVAFELRNYGLCIEYLDSALASQTKPLVGSMRTSAESVLTKAKSLIARVAMEVSPRASRVLVDGIPVELRDEQALVLEVGDHIIEVQSPGYLSERRTVSVVGGEEMRLSVKMQKPETSPAPTPAPPAVAPTPVKQQEEGRWYKNTWLWVGVSAVVVGSAVGLGLALRSDGTSKTQEVSGTPNTPAGGHLQALGKW